MHIHTIAMHLLYITAMPSHFCRGCMRPLRILLIILVVMLSMLIIVLNRLQLAPGNLQIAGYLACLINAAVAIMAMPSVAWGVYLVLSLGGMGLFAEPTPITAAWTFGGRLFEHLAR